MCHHLCNFLWPNLCGRFGLDVFFCHLLFMLLNVDLGGMPCIAGHLLQGQSISYLTSGEWHSLCPLSGPWARWSTDLRYDTDVFFQGQCRCELNQWVEGLTQGFQNIHLLLCWCQLPGFLISFRDLRIWSFPVQSSSGSFSVETPIWSVYHWRGGRVHLIRGLQSVVINMVVPQDSSRLLPTK